MFEGVKDLFKDVSFSVDQRIRNPYWFSFLILIIYYNWRGLLVLININDFKTIQEKEKAINSIEYFIWKPILLAIVGVLVFYIVQYLGLIISIFFQDRVKPNLLALISSKRFASVEKVKGLREMITNLSTEKSDLESELSNFQSKSKILLDEYVVKLENLEKERSEKEIALSEFENNLSTQENENKILKDKVKKLQLELERLRKTNMNLESLDNIAKSGIAKVRDMENWNNLDKSSKESINLKYTKKFKSDLRDYLNTFIKEEIDDSYFLIDGSNNNNTQIESRKLFIENLRHHIAKFFFHNSNEFNYHLLFISRQNLKSLIDQYFSYDFLQAEFLNVSLKIKQDLYDNFHSGLVSLVKEFHKEITVFINR